MCFQWVPTDTNPMAGIRCGFVFPWQEQREHEAATPGVYCASAVVERLSLCTYVEGQGCCPRAPDGYV